MRFIPQYLLALFLTSLSLVQGDLTCGITSQDRFIVAPKKNVFAPLTTSELTSVRDFMLGYEAVNLTAYDEATVSDNYIFAIEVLVPLKNASLGYYDRNATIPKRRAKARAITVVVFAGGQIIPEIIEYSVELPITNYTQPLRLQDYHRNTTIPFHSKPPDAIEYDLISELFGREMGSIKSITNDLLGGFFENSENDTLVYSDSSPRSYQGQSRKTWYWWMKNVEGNYLAPVGFWTYVDHSGTDPKRWKIIRIVYNNQVYPSIYSFSYSYKLKKVKASSMQSTLKKDFDFSRSRTNRNRTFDEFAGPTSQANTEKKRYQIDQDQHYVEWMDWSFYYSFTRDSGLSLWNIQFQGRRIVYELSLQEALAQYSGNDPLQGQSQYLDSHWGIGDAVNELSPDYECPNEGTRLNSTLYVTQVKVRPFAICVFESDKQIPLSRHRESGFIGATKTYALTIRSISAVYNYDYVFDYIFNYDGTIEVKVAATGFIQATFWQPGGNYKDFGSRVSAYSMGNIHDHVINYKVDLDIYGVDNYFEDLTVKVDTVKYPFFDYPVTQKKINRVRYRSERESRFKVDPLNPHTFLFTSNQLNALGERRGYRIYNPSPILPNMVLRTRDLEKNAEWAHYHLGVTVRKDNEKKSTSTYNQNLPGAPTVNWNDYFNGESLENKDLVAWVNIGGHHIPRGEDFPNTITTTSTSHFYISPFNYFDSEPSKDSRQAFLAHFGDEGLTDIDQFGVENSCLQDYTGSWNTFEE